MDVAATVTSKGQVTIPVTVRRALDLAPGSRIVFHVEDDIVVVEGVRKGRRARVKRLPDFFALAGSVPVPDELRGAEWSEVRRQAWEKVAERHLP
jgi:antitoxin PrlF